MKENIKAKNGYFELSLMLVGSMIGAGFITGSEIWYFFARFKFGLFFGVIVFVALIYLLIINEFKKINRDKVGGVKQRLDFLCEILVAAAMFSGLKIVLKQLSNNNYDLWFLLIVFVMFIILLFGFKLFKLYNCFVIVFLIFVVFVLLLNNNIVINYKFNINAENCIGSACFAFLYVFMNIATIKPIIRNFDKGRKIKNYKIVAIVFVFILSSLILLFSFILLNNFAIAKEQMPFLNLFINLSDGLGLVFMIGVVITMVSTALACMFGCKLALERVCGGGVFASSCVVLGAMILCFIPFNIFVSIFYPLIGFINFLFFVFDCLKNLKFHN